MPNVPGIYVVYKCDYDSYNDTVDVKSPLYIGDAQDIRANLNPSPVQQTKDTLFENLIKQAGGIDHICYGVIPLPEHSGEERQWVKDAIIYFQQPPLNEDESKDQYSHPAIDLTLESFPKCWKTTHILLPVV